MEFRSPLKQVRGLGAAHGGTHHWWMQRVTAVALVPLLLWFVFSVAGMGGADYATFRAWAAQPQVAVALILVLLASFYHGQLGLQVVIEDYVHTRWLEMTLQVLVRFLAVLLATSGILSVLRIALAG